MIHPCMVVFCACAAALAIKINANAASTLTDIAFLQVSQVYRETLRRSIGIWEILAVPGSSPLRLEARASLSHLKAGLADTNLNTAEFPAFDSICGCVSQAVGLSKFARIRHRIKRCDPCLQLLPCLVLQRVIRNEGDAKHRRNVPPLQDFRHSCLSPLVVVSGSDN